MTSQTVSALSLLPNLQIKGHGVYNQRIFLTKNPSWLFRLQTSQNFCRLIPFPSQALQLFPIDSLQVPTGYWSLHDEWKGKGFD